MSCQLICPNLRCRKILTVPEETRGSVIRCQHCSCLLRVPAPRMAGMAGPLSAPAPGGEEPSLKSPRHVA